MGSVSNPGGSDDRKDYSSDDKKDDSSDDRKDDENEDKKLETEKTKERKESKTSLSRRFSSSRRRNTEKLPTVFSYQTSQKRAYKQGGDDDPDKQKPNAPRYYTSQVKPEDHQPRYLVPRNDNERNVSSEVPTERTTVNNTQRQTLRVPQFNVGLWAAYPNSIPANVPACLAQLHNTDSLVVIQEIEYTDLALQWDDVPNLYIIQNSTGQCIYYAYETSSLLGQLCMKGERTLQVHVMDFYNNEVIYISRTCGSAEFFCCYPVVEVYSPPLNPVGVVYRRPYPIYAQFDILDEHENKIFTIKGPGCTYSGSTSSYVEFKILTVDGNKREVGLIKREIPQFSYNNGMYGLSFPSDLDVKIKAVLLGALFFIDYTF